MQLSINNIKQKFYSNITHTSPVPKNRRREVYTAPSMPAFTGNNVYMLDGGQHADDLYYFAKAIDKDFDLTIMPLELNPKDTRIKQLKSLKDNLEKINNLPKDKQPDYIAIPLGVHVSLQNLSNQMSKIFEQNIQLKPEDTTLSNEGGGAKF